MKGLNGAIGVVIALGMVVGCGDDDQSACRTAGQAICERACACREGAECALTDAMGNATISFDSESDCVGLFVNLGCSGGGDSTIDYDACESAVSGGMCIQAGTDDMGNPAQAFVSPDACNTMM